MLESFWHKPCPQGFEVYTCSSFIKTDFRHEVSVQAMSERVFHTRFQEDHHNHVVAEIYINGKFLYFYTICKVIIAVPQHRSTKISQYRSIQCSAKAVL